MAVIDLNTADVSELSSIEGLGYERAQDIIDYREDNGGFETLDELLEVPGMTEELVELLRERGVAVGEHALDD
jgi:competence protein ComEA